MNKNTTKGEKSLVPIEQIEETIFFLGRQKVMLSPHLAELYGIDARTPVQAVKRNLDRLPSDFMFQLTREEYENLKSQIVIASWGGPRRAFPYAFTEEGVAMLSSVLRSKRAVQVNIEIMRAFVRLRGLASTQKKLAGKLEELEREIKGHDESIRAIL